MDIIYYPDEQSFRDAAQTDDPLLLLVSHNEERIIVSPIDEAVEHRILLMKAGFKDTDIDKYFRLVLNSGGADWTFVCPTDFSTATRKEKRIEEYFREGMRIIPKALTAIGYDGVPIDIPKRYRRHFDIMNS